MLSIARRSDTVYRFSCNTSWRNCGDERWVVDGEQQTWTRLGASNDHSRLDRMSLLTKAPYLASLGRRWSHEEYCVSSTKHDANRPHILSHIGNRDLLQESHTNNDKTHKHCGEVQALSPCTSWCRCRTATTRRASVPSQSHRCRLEDQNQ
jgi:hypothetical protein